MSACGFTGTPLPSREYLLECLKYDPGTGTFVWKPRPTRHFDSPLAAKKTNSRMAGRSPKTSKQTGYKYLRIDGVLFSAHRIAYFLAYGRDPGAFLVDHINGVRDDNRACNLRLANRSQNGMNRTRLDVRNSSGAHNISLCAQTGRYKVRLVVSGREFWGGRHDTIEEAQLAAEKLRAKHAKEWRACL